MLTELSNLLIISDYNDEPNRSNQIMLDNFGKWERERDQNYYNMHAQLWLFWLKLKTCFNCMFVNHDLSLFLFSIGILDDILSYILSKGSEGSEGKSLQLLCMLSSWLYLDVIAHFILATVQQEVIRKCFHLLRRLTAEYKNVSPLYFILIIQFLCLIIRYKIDYSIESRIFCLLSYLRL